MQAVTGFFDMIKQFMGDNQLYVVVGIGCCIYLYFQDKQVRKLSLIIMLILIACIFNPISYRVLGEKARFSQTYYRFLWIVPCGIVFAYALYGIIRQIKNIKYRLALVIGVCFVILWMNVDKENLKLPDNVYQIPVETLEVAVHIEDLMSQDEMEDAIVLADRDINHTIRQYDAHIILPFAKFDVDTVEPTLNESTVLGLMSMLMYNRNDIPEEVIEELIIKNKIDYLVINMQNEVSLDYMQQMGWKIVSITSAYYILAR